MIQSVAYVSQFLNAKEERYSINELELLGLVLPTKYFKYYLFGRTFNVLTYHRSLLSIMHENRANRLYNSRLTIPVDRLLPFSFMVDHFSESKMQLVDCMLRKLQQAAAKISTNHE